MTKSLPLLKIARFLVVGATAFIVDAGSLYVLLNYFKLSLVLFNVIVAANVISVILGMSTSYALNRVWTFGQRAEKVPTQLARFLLVSIAIYVLNQLAFGLLHIHLGLDAMISKTIVTLCQMFASFVLYNYFVFIPKS